MTRIQTAACIALAVIGVANLAAVALAVVGSRKGGAQTTMN